MNLTRDRIRSIGWAVILTVCILLTAILTLRVNAVKGQVNEAEDRIIGLKREIVFLETEFKTRANQQQLKALNDVEFGYKAPDAGQYIEGERQLAALGKVRAPGAPAPIRVAQAPAIAEDGAFPQFVSPVAGPPETADAAPAPEPASVDSASESVPQESDDPVADAIHAADLADRLARIDVSGGESE